MLFWTIVKVGLKSLWANKLRSFLAMLGIIIGVGAVISMLAMGTGAQKQMAERFAAMGSNRLIVNPGLRGSHGVTSGTQQNLTVSDALAIAQEVEGVSMVAPAVNSTCQLKYFNKNARSVAFGTAPTYFSIVTAELEKGRFFTDMEVDRMARLAVIGSAVVENLFGSNEPVGEVIKVNGINFRVIGVMKSKGGQGWMNVDDRVIIPYTTQMKQLMGVDYLREIDVTAKDGVDLNAVQDGVTALLRKRHRVQEALGDDFSIFNLSEVRQAASETMDMFKMLLGGIASISLLVGGIGIMNIMLVTVTERTREIGIRKAIGAKERNILLQFLLEAIIISGLGGLIGVALGVGGAVVIGKVSTMFTTVVEATSILLALSFSGIVGIFFGFYPARRAAMLDPVEALRYE